MGETLEALKSENIYDDCPHFCEECHAHNCVECDHFVHEDESDHVPDIIGEIEIVLEAYEIPDDTITYMLEKIEQELYSSDI